MMKFLFFALIAHKPNMQNERINVKLPHDHKSNNNLAVSVHRNVRICEITCPNKRNKNVIATTIHSALT